MNTTNEMDRYVELLDKYLKQLVNIKNTYQNRIYEAMDYSLFTGGKRLRPIMAIKSFEMFCEDIDKVIPFAASIEMIHTYSLIHDDLPAMDDDDFRRGKPTNHKIFGEAMAILAGDGLLNLAFETMSDYTLKNSDSIEEYKRNVRAITEIGRYSGVKGMIGGQVVDLLGNFDNISDEMLRFMYEAKTAGLIQASLVSGAILGGAEDYEIEALREFGLNLGLAYQIKDDHLDLQEDNNINKLTYLKYYDNIDPYVEIERYSNAALISLRKLENRDTSFFEDLTGILINRTA